VKLDQPWCCLFSCGFLQLVYSILRKGELEAVIASYLIKANSKNGVPDILESNPRNPGEDGAPGRFSGVSVQALRGVLVTLFFRNPKQLSF